MLELDKIYNMDCIEGMKQLDDNSIDMILCDLPYGKTEYYWDSIISLDALWEQYKRIIKNNSAIVLTASQPFASKLVISNLNWFRYELIWDKINSYMNYPHANKMPLQRHENILIFYKRLPTYNPQFSKGKPYIATRSGGNKHLEGDRLQSEDSINKGVRYPFSIITFKADINRIIGTQKPLSLFEYLIKTYSNAGDIVLDNCMGSGTTAVACKRLNRRFIGFEINKEYYDISLQRLLNVPERLEKWIDS
ncbi:MAG: DNA-methyltransferase [Candidatus Hodarchaeota archaeon]